MTCNTKEKKSCGRRVRAGPRVRSLCRWVQRNCVTQFQGHRRTPPDAVWDPSVYWVSRCLGGQRSMLKCDFAACEPLLGPQGVCGAVDVTHEKMPTSIERWRILNPAGHREPAKPRRLTTSQLFRGDRQHSARVCCVNTLCGGESSRAAWYLGFNPLQQCVAFCGQISKTHKKEAPWNICVRRIFARDKKHLSFYSAHWRPYGGLAAAGC